MRTLVTQVLVAILFLAWRRSTPVFAQVQTNFGNNYDDPVIDNVDPVRDEPPGMHDEELPPLLPPPPPPNNINHRPAPPLPPVTTRPTVRRTNSPPTPSSPKNPSTSSVPKKTGKTSARPQPVKSSDSDEDKIGLVIVIVGVSVGIVVSLVVLVVVLVRKLKHKGSGMEPVSHFSRWKTVVILPERAAPPKAKSSSGSGGRKGKTKTASATGTAKPAPARKASLAAKRPARAGSGRDIGHVQSISNAVSSDRRREGSQSKSLRSGTSVPKSEVQGWLSDGTPRLGSDKKQGQTTDFFDPQKSGKEK